MTRWMRWFPGWRLRNIRPRVHGLKLRPKELFFSPAGVVLLYLLLSPLWSLLNQSVFLAVAALLRTASATQLPTRLLVQFGFDPVYASVLDQGIGNIEVRGLAIAGPVGGALHQLAPGLFAPSELVSPGAWVSAVASDGVSLLASTLAAAGAEVAFIVAGLFLLGIGLRGHRAMGPEHRKALTVLGLLFQIRGVIGLLGIGLTLDDVEAMGLSQIFTKLLPLDVESYHSLMDGPLRPVASILIPAGLVLAIYGTIAGLGLIVTRLWRRGPSSNRHWGDGMRGLASAVLAAGGARRRLRAACVVLAVVLSVLLSQRLVPAQAHYAGDQIDQPQLDSQSVSEDKPSAMPQVVVTPKPTPAGPSRVVISNSNTGHTYTVNGRPERIHGVGYNALYTDLTPEERATHYDQDFSAMRAAGVNTILGWGPQQFDELLLAKAQEHGLGVVMPYRLSGDGDYGDPLYQEKVKQDVLEWVRRYRSFPALRMWGIGNEVIHHMGNNPNTPRARAFAEFYVSLADEVHALDPDHPVTYREAEDVYLSPMKQALKEGAAPARPWFVYGVNFFTYRLCDALQYWSDTETDIPLIVSEFAPAGLGRDGRPEGYQRMWRCIADHPETVLGGFAYVWVVKGPEALDRSFGLVDMDGKPTDGSLAALGEVYRRDTADR